MLSSASDWLRHLVVLVLLAVFLDAALPSGATQKYVRAVLSLIVMLSLLQPLQALVRANLNFSELAAQIGQPSTAAASEGIGSGAGLRQYRVDLAAAIRSGVQSAVGVTLSGIQILTSDQNGAPVVSGVQAQVDTGLGGRGNPNPQAVREAQAEIAVMLGLPPSRISLSVPGAQTPAGRG